MFQANFKKIYIYVFMYMSAIDGQAAGPNWLKLFMNIHRYPGGDIG